MEELTGACAQLRTKIYCYKCSIMQYPLHAFQTFWLISSDGGYQNCTLEINRFTTTQDRCGGMLLSIDQRILSGMTNCLVYTYSVSRVRRRNRLRNNTAIKMPSDTICLISNETTPPSPKNMAFKNYIKLNI